MLRYFWHAAGVLMLVVVVLGHYSPKRTIMEGGAHVGAADLVTVDIRTDSGQRLNSILDGIEPIEEFAEMFRIENRSVHRSCVQESQGILTWFTSLFSTTVYAQTCGGAYMYYQWEECGGTGSCNDLFIWYYSDPYWADECDGYLFDGFDCGECHQEAEWDCISCL